MKIQIYALSDSFPSPDDLKKKKKLVWCGRLMAKIFTFNSTNVINYTMCIFFLFHKIIMSCIIKGMTEPPMNMMTRLEAVVQMYGSVYDQWL